MEEGFVKVCLQKGISSGGITMPWPYTLLTGESHRFAFNLRRTGLLKFIIDYKSLQIV